MLFDVVNSSVYGEVPFVPAASPFHKICLFAIGLSAFTLTHADKVKLEVRSRLGESGTTTTSSTPSKLSAISLVSIPATGASFIILFGSSGSEP